MEPVQHCRNCEVALPEGAAYCPACGQKRSDGRLTVLELFQQLIDTVFNIDSKFFRTIGTLFIPGSLTLQYFKGKHKSYVHPVRVFLVSLLLLLAAFGYFIDDVNMGEMDRRTQLEKSWVAGTIRDQLDSLKGVTQNEFPQPAAQAAIDSLSLRLTSLLDAQIQDSVNVSNIAVVFSQEEEPPIKIAVKDLFELSGDQILEKYEVTDFWSKVIVKQQIKFQTKAEGFISYVLGLTTWMVFLMMPFLALTMKLFYIRRPFYFVEHLVFSFHVHSFLFVLTTLMLILSSWVWAKCWIVYPFIFLVYLPWAMWRVYQQSWFKTLMKFSLISFFYLFLLSIFFVLTVTVGFLMY